MTRSYGFSYVIPNTVTTKHDPFFGPLCSSLSAMLQQQMVTVPAGVGPGMPFMVNLQDGSQMQVTCPPDAQAGGQMIVNVPMVAAPEPLMMGTVLQEQAPVPLVAATPVLAPVPMAMGNPNAAAAPGLTFKFPCSAEKGKGLEATFGTGVPPALSSRGMTQGEWSECCDALKEVYNAQFFKNCTALECIYFCVPGGPLQAACCLCNPVTCVLCIQPVESAKNTCVAKCNPILSKYGYMARAVDWDMEDTIEFCPR